MKRSTLFDLHCPYCGSGLELISQIDSHGEEIINAVLRCDCRKYPLVEGILVLRTLNVNAVNKALLAMEENRPAGALLRLLEPRTTSSRIIQAAKQRKLPFSHTIERMRVNCLNHYLQRIIHADSFSSLIGQIKFIGYGGYFKYRFSTTSFIAGIPLILLMRDFAGPILEIGCGMGHQGFVISQLYPQRELVLTDLSFVNLYLSKNFFVPDAEYICLDANDPLPFPDRSFNAIFTSDFFHYLHSKKIAMQEISRISATDAIILLSHLHHPNGGDPVPGETLTALGWMRLAVFPQTKLLTETGVFKNFLSEDRLDLLYEPTQRELQEENALALIGTSRQELFRVYQGFREQFFNLRTHLVVNPLYHISYTADKVLLKKNWPTKFIQAENINIDKILPDIFSLDRQFLKEISEGNLLKLDIHRVVELMEKFILVNVPQNY